MTYIKRPAVEHTQPKMNRTVKSAIVLNTFFHINTPALLS